MGKERIPGFNHLTVDLICLVGFQETFQKSPKPQFSPVPGLENNSLHGLLITLEILKKSQCVWSKAIRGQAGSGMGSKESG